ncbi:MAG: HEAT repeat domain-containing protein [Planctomycetota bacterium]
MTSHGVQPRQLRRWRLASWALLLLGLTSCSQRFPALLRQDPAAPAQEIVQAAESGDPRLTPGLLRILHSWHEGDRSQAAAARVVTASIALAERGDLVAVGALIQLADDPNEALRVAAAEALGLLGGAQAEDCLERLARADPSLQVRRRARQARNVAA